MHTGEWIFATVCLTWWLLLLLKQFRPAWLLRAMRHDVFWIVPSFRYFAPEPNFYDYFVEFRIRDEGGSPGDWKPMPLYRPRNLLSAVWNPGFVRVSLFENRMEKLIGKLRAGMPPDDLLSSLHYEGVRNTITRAVDVPAGSTLQFRVLTGHAFQPDAQPTAALLSSWHTSR